MHSRSILGQQFVAEHFVDVNRSRKNTEIMSRYYLCCHSASGEGIVTLGICVCVCVFVEP